MNLGSQESWLDFCPRKAYSEPLAQHVADVNQIKHVRACFTVLRKKLVGILQIFFVKFIMNTSLYSIKCTVYDNSRTQNNNWLYSDSSHTSTLVYVLKTKNYEMRTNKDNFT